MTKKAIIKDNAITAMPKARSRKLTKAEEENTRAK